jgi:hypothetical protein
MEQLLEAVRKRPDGRRECGEFCFEEALRFHNKFAREIVAENGHLQQNFGN